MKYSLDFYVKKCNNKYYALHNKKEKNFGGKQ